MTIFLAFFIGIVAGLRAMTAPAAVSWAARFGLLNLGGTGLAFLGYRFTPWILTALALFELFTDQLPTTPSRKMPLPFSARVFNGALCGWAIGLGAGSPTACLLTGALGGIAGTLGGAEGRRLLARAFKKDPPAAFLEDAVAIAGAIFVIMALV